MGYWRGHNLSGISKLNSRAFSKLLMRQVSPWYLALGWAGRRFRAEGVWVRHTSVAPVA